MVGASDNPTLPMYVVVCTSVNYTVHQLAYKMASNNEHGGQLVHHVY